MKNAEKERGDEGSELDAKHARQDSVKALRKLFEDFEAQLNLQGEVDQALESSKGSEEEMPADLPGQLEHPLGCHSRTTFPAQEQEEDDVIRQEPQLYLCDDSTRPVEIMKKPCKLLPQDMDRSLRIISVKKLTHVHLC